MLRTLFITIACLGWALATAQRPEAPAAVRPVPESTWERAAGDLDYSDDRPSEPPAQKEKKPGGRDWTQMNEFWGRLLQVLGILAATALIAYGIYRMLQAPRNKQIAADGVEITLTNLDNYLQESDLDPFLQEALRREQYAEAVRLYFLLAIQALSSHGDIVWARQKTNRDYLRDMRDHRLGNTFDGLVRTYEHIWYGNRTVSAADFQQLEPEFKAFIQQITERQ